MERMSSRPNVSFSDHSYSRSIIGVASSYKNPGINEYIMRFSSMQEVVWQYVVM